MEWSIPTRVGNTSASSSLTVNHNGPSPRLWGIRRLTIQLRHGHRSIPTRVGNTNYLSLIGLDFTRDSRPVFTTDDRTMFTTHDRPVFTTVGQSLPRMKRERNRQNGADPYEHLQRNHLPDTSRRK